jgi:hypothetical protein
VHPRGLLNPTNGAQGVSPATAHGWATASSPFAQATTPGGTTLVAHRPSVGAEYWLLPVGRSWQAVVAPWLGLFGVIIPLLGIAGIFFGVWALRLPMDPTRPGRVRPVVGIVLGLIGVAFWLLVLVASLAAG